MAQTINIKVCRDIFMVHGGPSASTDSEVKRSNLRLDLRQARGVGLHSNASNNYAKYVK